MIRQHPAADEGACRDFRGEDCHVQEEAAVEERSNHTQDRVIVDEAPRLLALLGEEALLLVSVAM